ncbi:MAG: dihydropteroate [Planctomycetota bacterium]|nr:MAG: dihydropteroate [Planctomycetota bacterium]
MTPDEIRLNPRVVASASAASLKAELSRLGFPGDVRDLAPARLAKIAVAIENLAPAEAFEVRARWAAGGGEVLIAGDPFSTAAVPAVVTGTREQFEKTTTGIEAILSRALQLFHAVPAPVGGLEFGRRTHLMGIVNVTPDSFSDGGKFAEADAAIAQGERLAAAGASILDVGGESTRPGAEPVSAAEEMRRVLPVLTALAKRLKVPVSIDTTKADVARAALDAGAVWVNDISGLRLDPAMAALVAERGVPAVVMHMKGTPRTMQQGPQYRDPVAEICAWLRESLAAAARAGIAEERLIVDPGIGFGKTMEQNLEILARLREFRTLGRPVLVGVSRKSFIGKLTGLEAPARALPSAGAAAWCIAQGADILRVHDVEETETVRRVVDAIARG